MIRERTLTRRRGIRPVSAKRAKLNKIYSSLRKKFLEDHPYCEWFMAEHFMNVPEVHRLNGRGICNLSNAYVDVPRSEDVHHRRGRGKYFLDVSTWLAVSREGHDHIHNNPKESYEKGHMLPR